MYIIYVLTLAYTGACNHARREFEQIGEFQRQHMAPVHQFELGLLHTIDLKYWVARELSFFRPMLSPVRRGMYAQPGEEGGVCSAW